MRSLARRLRRSGAPVLVAVCSLSLGCFFNSDDRFAGEEGSTTELPTSTSAPEWTSGEPLPIPDMMQGDATCRDAVDCLVECAAAIQIGPGEGDEELGCLLECEAGLTVEEALALLRLASCQGQVCFEQGECGGGDEETGGEEGGGGPLGPGCLECITGGILDPEPPGCQEEAANCK